MPFEKVAPAVKRQLLAQRQVAAMQEYVGNLRDKLGYQNDLSPPRFEIAIGTSPSEGPADAADHAGRVQRLRVPLLQIGRADREAGAGALPDAAPFRLEELPARRASEGASRPRKRRCARRSRASSGSTTTCSSRSRRRSTPPQLAPYAEQLGLDKAKFEECLASHRTEAIVAADLEAGKKAGVSGTPAFFVNGVPLASGRSLNEFAKSIDTELARLKLPVPPPPPPPSPAARMQMPMGHPGQPQIVVPGAIPPPAPPEPEGRSTGRAERRGSGSECDRARRAADARAGAADAEAVAA